MVSSNTAKVVRNSECSRRICSSVTSVFPYSSGSLMGEFHMNDVRIEMPKVKKVVRMVHSVLPKDVSKGAYALRRGNF